LGTAGSSAEAAAGSALALDHEIALIEATLEERGALARHDIEVVVRAQLWGPGRFGVALGEALAEGRAARDPQGSYRPAGVA
jgi:hypothetical protein